MLVEHLRFRVGAGQTGAFLARNRRWLAALRRQPGFLAQRTFRHADRPDVWLVTIAWRDKAAIETFPDDVRRELDRAGASAGTLERAEHYREAEE